MPEPREADGSVTVVRDCTGVIEIMRSTQLFMLLMHNEIDLPRAIIPKRTQCSLTGCRQIPGPTPDSSSPKGKTEAISSLAA